MKSLAIWRLEQIATLYSAPNWDGDNARGLHPEAVFNAKKFVNALPDGFPPPEFAPDPDGSISLEWTKSRDRQFSLSVGPDARFPYAWLDGTAKGCAVMRFDGERIPPMILECIREILNGDKHAIIRPF